MKIRILIILLLTAAAMFAGTVCFDIPAGGPTNRVAAAVGAVLNLTDASGSPRPATQTEVSQFASDYIRMTTQDYERRQNQQAFQPSPVPIQISPAPSPTALAASVKAPSTPKPTPRKK